MKASHHGVQAEARIESYFWRHGWFWRYCLAGALGLLSTRVAVASTAEEDVAAQTASETPVAALRGYLRPYLGWGGAVLSDPDNFPSWYRYAGGLGGGVKLSEISLGLDFVYFSGAKFRSVDSLEDPMIELDTRRHAFRLAVDVGYDFDLEWIVLRPHLLGGIEWRRSTVGDRHRTTESFHWAPAMAALVPLRRGAFLVGADARAGMILVDGSVEVQFAGFLVFEAVF
jgi:hypothetical protein